MNELINVLIGKGVVRTLQKWDRMTLTQLMSYITELER